MKFFFLKLIPPRPTFALDMSDSERETMMAHVQYWHPFIQDGTMIVSGPVLDPNGSFGMGVIKVDSEQKLNELLNNDPAVGLNSIEYYPMPIVAFKQ